MANNDGFVDALGPGVEDRLKKYNTMVLDLVGNIDKLNAKQLGAKTPSQSDGVVKELNAQLKAQEIVIVNLQKEYTKLAEAKRKTNQLTVQEKVDNSALNQQERQRATIISEVVGAYRNLSAAEAQAARKLQDLISAGRTGTQTQRQYNAELRKAQKEFDVLNARVLKADAAVGRWNRTGQRSIVLANELASSLGLAFGVAGLAMLGKSIFDITRELQSLDLALTQVVGSQEEAARVQGFLADIAERYGVNIQTLTKSYIGFYAGSKNAIESGKISAVEIQKIFESVAKASGALGLSQEQQQGAFLAIQQMISKGNVQAEELRGQLSERLPGAFGILAKSMGVTEVQLNKLLKDGKVLAAEVLPAFARELEKAYGIENLQRVETLNASVTRLGNSWTDFVAALNDGDGVFSASISGLIDKLAEAVKGASIILESAESTRNRTLTAIRQAGYEDQKATYGMMEQLDKDYVAKKNIFFQQEIQRLQLQANDLKNINDQIRINANNSIYVPNAPEILKENQVAIKALNNEIKSYYGRLAAGREILEASNVAQKEKIALTDKERKALARLAEEQAKNNYSRQLSDLERQKFLIEERLKDEAKYADDKIELSNMIYEKERQILTLQLFENIRLHKKSLDLQQIDRNNFRTADEKAEKENQERILKIKTDAYNEYREYVEKYGRKSDEQQFGTGTTFLPTEDLDKMLNDWKEFKKKQTEADDEATEKMKKNLKDYSLSFTESFLGDAGLSEIFKILNKEIEGFGKDAKVTALAISEAFQQLFNFLSKASEDNFQSEYEDLERKKNISIAFAGESEVAKYEIEKQYDEQRKRIKEREAKAAKELAIFNAVINTAQAVVGALPNIPLSILVGLIGAAQIALISSKSIPEFWKGTDNAPGGLAWTQEKGREIITDRHNRVKSMGSDGGASLTKLSPGDKVITNERTRQLMFDNGLNSILSDRGIGSTPNINIVGLTPEQYFSGVARTEAAIKNFAPIHISEDRRGKVIYQGSSNSRIQSMNNRIEIKGTINP